ncbi:MAG: M48 family metallopeptidase [Anaerolineae bacterium]
MSDLSLEVKAGDETLTVEVTVDSRLRTMARWSLHGTVIKLRIPRGTSHKDVQRLIEGIIPRVARQRKRSARRTDVDLTQRAQEINQRYFNGELMWNSIRWVSNMRNRLGSCTTGGATDGDIRISERIRNWPQYVVDYVIAHEICHRKHPDHSAAFWDFLARYPHTEKALGFIEGIGFSEGHTPDEMMD